MCWGRKNYGQNLLGMRTARILTLKIQPGQSSRTKIVNVLGSVHQCLVQLSFESNQLDSVTQVMVELLGTVQIEIVSDTMKKMRKTAEFRPDSE